MGVRIVNYDRFWETFFQDVGREGTDNSGDIDLEVRVHIQHVVPILEQIHCYFHVWTFWYYCFIFTCILINKYIKCYILFPFCPADSTIVATVSLEFEADICMIYC